MAENHIKHLFLFDFHQTTAIRAGSCPGISALQFYRFVSH
jgi:hypothetical protein